MIQIQVSIEIAPDGTGVNDCSIALNRLEREDANEAESIFADAFDAHIESLIIEINRLLSEQGVEATFKEIKKQ